MEVTSLSSMPQGRTKATMLSVFPYVVAVDWVLIGSDSAIAVSKDALMAQIKEPHTRDYLAFAGVNIVDIVRQLSQSRIESWTPSDPRGTLDVNTDMTPKDEFYLNNSEGVAPSKPAVP